MSIQYRLELDQHQQHSPAGLIVGPSEPSDNRQSMTIGDQSEPMFHDDVSHRIHLAMGSIGHPCSTIIQGSARYLSLMTVQALREVSVFDQAVLLLPCCTNNHYLRPGLNVVIKPYKLALLPTASIDFLSLVCNFQ